MGKKHAGNKMDVDAIVSSAPAFAVVSPLRHDDEEEEWFGRNFAADDPCVFGPSHRAAGDAATPGAAVIAQAVVGAGSSISSSAPVPTSKRRRVVSVDGGNSSIASVSVVANSWSPERRNEVGQQSAVSSGNVNGVPASSTIPSQRQQAVAQQ